MAGLQGEWTRLRAGAAAGISADQAGLLDALFAGPEALVEPARPCSISELQTLYMRCAHLPAAWEALCAVWDVGLVRSPSAGWHECMLSK